MYKEWRLYSIEIQGIKIEDSWVPRISRLSRVQDFKISIESRITLKLHNSTEIFTPFFFWDGTHFYLLSCLQTHDKWLTNPRTSWFCTSSWVLTWWDILQEEACKTTSKWFSKLLQNDFQNYFSKCFSLKNYLFKWFSKRCFSLKIFFVFVFYKLLFKLRLF